MDWSPEDAMKAYMQTLTLCRESQDNEDPIKRATPVEPESVEFISALAAGNRARLIVDVATGGISQSTLALAAAAKCTGGRLVCVRTGREDLEEIETQLAKCKLEDVVRVETGSPPEILKKYSGVEFAMVDGRIEDRSKVFDALDMNPRGSVVVVDNVFHRKVISAFPSYARVVRGREGVMRVQSAVLPIGKGMEVTRIKNSSR